MSVILYVIHRNLHYSALSFNSLVTVEVEGKRRKILIKYVSETFLQNSFHFVPRCMSTVVECQWFE